MAEKMVDRALRARCVPNARRAAFEMGSLRSHLFSHRAWNARSTLPLRHPRGHAIKFEDFRLMIPFH
jgi:hypothetical protein